MANGGRLMPDTEQLSEARLPDAGGEGGWFRFRIGALEATIVSDGRMRPHTIEGFFPRVPKADREDCQTRNGILSDCLSMEQNCLVLRGDAGLVLFDTGIGGDLEYGWEHSGKLMENLARAGLDPKDVTAVVLTHVHCDHVWGMVDDRGDAQFPNAQVYLSRPDFEFWTDEAKLGTGGFTETYVKGARRNLLPYLAKLHFIEDGEAFLPHIRAVASPGHSIGHMSYIIESDGQRYLFLGDVVHSTELMFENPDWPFAYDFDSSQAAQTRRRLFDLAVAQGLGLIGYHFAFPGIGAIVRQGRAFRYVPGVLAPT